MRPFARFLFIALAVLVVIPFLTAAYVPPLTVTKEGATTITDKVNTKIAGTEKMGVISSEINKNITEQKFPYTFTVKDTTITIKKIQYDESESLNGYWIEATRGGKLVETHSPIWVHGQPYITEKSRSLDAKTSTVNIVVVEDPLGAVKDTLYQYVRTKPLGKPQGDDVLFIYVTTLSDLVGSSSSSTFAVTRADVGDNRATDDAYNAVGLFASSTSNQYTEMDRAGNQVNTSGLNDAAIVDSAIAGFYIYDKSEAIGAPTYSITGFAPATNGSFVNTDFSKFTQVSYSASIAYADITTNQYTNWTANAAFIANISKTGWTNYMLRDSWDYANSFGGTWASGQGSYLLSQGKTGAHPDFLEITYHTGGVSAPVASFTIDKTLTRIPKIITVTDTSTNTPTSWEWSWGDGTANSTTQNPTHQYVKRGRWNIDLTATNAGGSGVSSTTQVRVVGYENY